MALSSNNVSGIVRTPRLRVLIDGVEAPRAMETRITSTNYYSCDSFHVAIAYGPDKTSSASYWSTASPTVFDIQISAYETEGYRSLIQGYPDSVMIDPINGVIHIEGRDLSASVIDACTQDSFENHSAYEIVTIIALRHGLIPIVYPTADLVGRYFGSSRSEIRLSKYSKAITEWDVIVQLARAAGYDAFVEGRSLYFQPSGLNMHDVVPMTLQDLTNIRLERNMPLAGDVQVVVKSWNSQLHSAVFSGTTPTPLAPETVNNPGFLASGFQRIVIEPNLGPSEVTSLARQFIDDIGQHGKTIELEMPGELNLTPRKQISLSGTQTDFDQMYDIEYIDRIFSATTGFRQRIRGRLSTSAMNIAKAVL